MFIFEDKNLTDSSNTNYLKKELNLIKELLTDQKW